MAAYCDVAGVTGGSAWRLSSVYRWYSSRPVLASQFAIATDQSQIAEAECTLA